MPLPKYKFLDLKNDQGNTLIIHIQMPFPRIQIFTPRHVHPIFRFRPISLCILPRCAIGRSPASGFSVGVAVGGKGVGGMADGATRAATCVVVAVGVVAVALVAQDEKSRTQRRYRIMKADLHGFLAGENAIILPQYNRQCLEGMLRHHTDPTFDAAQW